MIRVGNRYIDSLITLNFSTFISISQHFPISVT